ncbi:multidrug ABC transporter substrate-binding protein [Devosia limi DSM 17137]|uniref:Lipoprotein-releasing system permease protein n=1 Tax=Devosia limi DSM 17137 TaxID=1121477 RepID=A0A0F5LNT0_9HYPH|nr:ABC transporter permease [Devosia limi]KKB83774.1 multidrug ABC transporter substrate-binding protein [Devosia limi DSM 17137]SHE70497.1 lipoprotein-releasing system permease protein [Devosia limi DSM 17137]
MTDEAAPALNKGTRAFSRFEWLVAGRYLRARRKDAFISVIAALTMTGVAIGVATLIVVMSVMNGFRAELLTKILGLNGHFTAIPIESQFTDYKETVAALEQVDGVKFAVYFVEGQVLASGPGSSTGVTVRGMDAENLEKLDLLYGAAVQGGWDSWDDSRGVAIGYRLAQKLGVSLGDQVQLINPDGQMTPFGSTPQVRSYPVNVIFDLGMVEFDSFFLYMPIGPAQDFFKMYEDVLKPGQEPLDPMASDEEIDAAYMRVGQASAAEIFINNPDDIATMRGRLQADQTMRPMVLTDWQQRNETFFSALQVERVVMFTILSMIILVAAFNIISSLVMLVKDKSADIAVLRTMGATRGSIMRIFSMTGTAIGVVGTLVGLVLGLIVAANAEGLRAFVSNTLGVAIFPPEVFFLSTLPSKTDPYEVTVVVCLALGLSFLATIYPAWRAAQYDPVEALRYE